jgi:hypothetical protein
LELEQKRKSLEENEIRYCLEHCGKFKAKNVPDFGMEVFGMNREQKQKLGELLELNDEEVTKDLRKIGGGDLVVGSGVIQSVDKFVKRITNARMGK